MPKPTMLFATTDRDEAHRFLADVLDGPGKSPEGMTPSPDYSAAMALADEDDHPLAECREDPNSKKPYQVWSGPDA